MADLVVNTSLLNDRGSDFEKISKKISAIANETDKTIKSLNFSGRLTVAFDRSGRNFKATINTSASNARKLSGALKNAASLYAQTDKNVGDKKFGAAKKKKSGALSLDFGILEKVGIIGGGYGAVKKLSDGVKKMQAGKWALGVKDVISSGKTLFSAFKTARKADKGMELYKRFKMPASKNATLWWKNALGLRDYFAVNGLGAVSKSRSLAMRWANNARKVAGKELKAGSLAAGALVSGICNGLSNYDKYKSGKISANKAVKKTIVQTTLDVALDKGLTIAVTAGLAAVCGGAPVLAVAACTFVIKKGLDAATTSLSKGKYDGLTDFASDKIVDGFDAVTDFFVKTKKKEYKMMTDVLVNCGKEVKKGASVIWGKKAA